MAKRKETVTQQDIRLAAYEALIARHGGTIGPRTLLDEARDPSSPFHEMFEWDDEEGGEQYRLIQASQIIRRWKGSVMKIDIEHRTVEIKPRRAVQSIAERRTKGGDSYERIEDIMSDPQKRENMVQTVLRELMAYRRRYAELVELSEIWQALEDAVDQYAPKKSRPNDDDSPQPVA